MVKKLSLAEKLGKAGAKAYSSRKADATVAQENNQQDLPKIDNGVAELVDIKFDQFKNGVNKGEMYFMASAKVVSPKTVKVDGKVVKVEGRRTSIIEPLCETPGRTRESVEDHLAWVLNQLRLLGLATEGIEFDDLEESCGELVDAEPSFEFSTWLSTPSEAYPDPRTNHTWGASVEEEEESEEEDDEEEEEVEEEEVEEEEEGEEEEETDDQKLRRWVEEADEEDEDAQTSLLELAEEKGIEGAEDMDEWSDVAAAILEEISLADSEEEEEEDSDEEEEEEDWKALAEAADNEEDEDAMEKLDKAAEENELDPDDFETYAELVDAINGEEDEEEEVEEEEEEDEEEEDEEPVKGDIVGFKPPRARKEVDCEVTNVVKSKKTVNLKNLDNDKTYKTVSWDRLTF